MIAVQKSSAAVAVFVEWWIVYCVCGMVDTCSFVCGYVQYMYVVDLL